jgi:hypothetical protein
MFDCSDESSCDDCKVADNGDEFCYAQICSRCESCEDEAKSDGFIDFALPSLPFSLRELNSKDLQTLLLAYHLFGLLWVNQFLQGVTMVTIAGAVCQYYWTRPNGVGERDLGSYPVASALFRTCRFHLGSIAFGSLIIAIVQFIRICLEYLDKQTRNIQEANKLVKVVMKMVKCCMWCFEKVLKYITRSAYICIAMKGGSFCFACRDAFMLLLRNFKKIAVVDAIAFFILTLAKLSITCTCTIMTYMVLNSDMGEHFYDEAPNSLMLPIICTAFVSYFVGSTFTSVFGLAIDAILLCFCYDSEKNSKSGKVFMSDELARYIHVNKVRVEGQSVKEVEDDDATGATAAGNTDDSVQKIDEHRVKKVSNPVKVKKVPLSAWDNKSEGNMELM